MSTDLRLCLFGDSFAAGVGDPTGAGWIGLVVATARRRGLEVTVYNLGIRRDTSIDISHRWLDEAHRRLKDSAALGVIFAFGTNDVDDHRGRCRVPAPRTLELLGQMLDDAHSAGWATLVVGPPPVADSAATELAGELSSGMAQVCRTRGVPFVDVGAALRTDPVWTQEVATGDGSHPSACGYQRFAQCVETPVLQWLGVIGDLAHGRLVRPARRTR